MQKRIHNICLILFWGAAFALVSFVLNLYGFRSSLTAKMAPQAQLLEEMSQSWLHEAHMTSRIFVQEIILKKSDNKLIGIQVTLVSKEEFADQYQKQLLHYLARKGFAETGLPFTFSIKKI